MVIKLFDHEIGFQSRLMLTVIRYFISFSFIIFARFWQGYRKRVSQLLRFRVNPFPRQRQSTGNSVPDSFRTVRGFF